MWTRRRCFSGTSWDAGVASVQVVYIEEMGESDMEMMTVSRLDFWPIHKENIENAKKVEEKVRQVLLLLILISRWKRRPPTGR